MEKLRYKREFKECVIGCLVFLILSGLILGFFIVSTVQYHLLVSDMVSLKATIVDIEFDFHVRGPNEREATIAYMVDGITYRRELSTDTPLSFAAGTGAHYSVGDTVTIFYDPQNPEIIATPRSVGVGSFCALIALAILIVFLYLFILMMRKHRKFLVTQEEYEQEGKERKQRKLAKKEQKRSRKSQRK